MGHLWDERECGFSGANLFSCIFIRIIEFISDFSKCAFEFGVGHYKFKLYFMDCKLEIGIVWIGYFLENFNLVDLKMFIILS